MGNKPSATGTKNNNSFIIEFNCNKRNTVDHVNDPLCSKRVIFISLIGLFQGYKTCPSHVLCSSLLIIPLKKKWIYSPAKYLAELQSVSSGLIRRDTRSFAFFEMMKWKDSQGLVLWAKDEYKSSFDDRVLTPIHSFWHSVSDKLVSLYDPTTSTHYKPLLLDPKHWTQQIGKTPECNLASISDVVHEIYFRSLNFASMKRILHASNPGSFRVLTVCPTDLYTANGADPVFVKLHRIMDDDADAQADDEWCVSSDYF